MKTILALLFTTGLFATAARADVFIYRGVFKVTADLVTGAPFPPSLNIYIVVDYDGAQYGSLAFGQLSGGKHFTQSAAATYNFGSAPLAKGHTASFFISSGDTDTSPTSFNNTALYFRGNDTSLLIRKMPTSTLADRPNTLKSIGVQANRNNSTGSFVEAHMALTFQGAATIKANNANQTIDQVLDALAATLTAKGFTSL